MTLAQADTKSTLIVNYHFIDVDGDYSRYDGDRANFQRIYGGLIREEAALSGRVLDIGCGHGVNASYKFFGDKIGQLDGVDPFPAIEPPAHLANRWECGMEDIPMPPKSYDLAYSYNVVEHIENVEPFLTKVVEMLKPGAAYWSMSPNYYHPFTFITRLVQRSGILDVYRKYVNARANDYPAYYRLSNDKNILKAIRENNLPVSKIDFYYIPNVNWDSYFPRPLRFIARAIDEYVLLRAPKRSFIFMFRLERAAETPPV